MYIIYCIYYHLLQVISSLHHLIDISLYHFIFKQDFNVVPSIISSSVQAIYFFNPFKYSTQYFAFSSYCKTQKTFTCSKSRIETVEKGVEYVQN